MKFWGPVQHQIKDILCVSKSLKSQYPDTQHIALHFLSQTVVKVTAQPSLTALLQEEHSKPWACSHQATPESLPCGTALAGLPKLSCLIQGYHISGHLKSPHGTADPPLRIRGLGRNQPISRDQSGSRERKFELNNYHLFLEDREHFLFPNTRLHTNMNYAVYLSTNICHKSNFKIKARKQYKTETCIPISLINMALNFLSY